MAGIREAVRHRLRGGKLRRRIAWLSPMPSAPTGVASYSKAVLDGLTRTGFTKRQEIEPVWPVGPKHEATIPWYAMGVYHLGNNVEFHRDIYRHAAQTPGLVVIHDLGLDDFVRGMIAGGDPLGHQAAREAATGVDRLRPREAELDEPLRTPWVSHIARRARGIVVHSEFGRRYLRDHGCRTPVFVVPHPVVESESDVRRAHGRRDEIRAPLAAAGMETVVGVFGDLNAAKLIDVVCGAVAGLPDPAHLALVGRTITGYEVDAVVRQNGLGARASIHADVSDADFLAWLCAADVVVDLRYPHRGEVSGSLARAMRCGRPTIVSATGSYLDLPDDVVVRVSPGRLDPAELAAAIGRLVNERGLAEMVGERAREHMAELARSEATAHGYERAIVDTLGLVRDPARRAMARWAGALADLGVTAEHLERGYGLSYARALQELMPSGGSRP